MAHNYYADYKIQYQQDRRKGTKPELSELVVQGMAYCTAILFAAGKVSHFAYSRNEQRLEEAWQGCIPAINTSRGYILRHDVPSAVGLTNSITSVDISSTIDAMRYEFEDVLFSTDYIDELSKSGAIDDESGAIAAMQALFSATANNEVMKREMLHVMAQSNRAAVSYQTAWSPELKEIMARDKPFPEAVQAYAHPKVPWILTARNPIFQIGIGIAYADIAATKLEIEGKLTPGPIDGILKFTADTSYYMPINRSEHNKYQMLRRLKRGAMSYVPGFDIYLTYITDFCRILEAIMPEEVVREALEDAQKFITVRSTQRPGLQPYQ